MKRPHNRVARILERFCRFDVELHAPLVGSHGVNWSVKERLKGGCTGFEIVCNVNFHLIAIISCPYICFNMKDRSESHLSHTSLRSTVVRHMVIEIGSLIDPLGN